MNTSENPTVEEPLFARPRRDSRIESIVANTQTWQVLRVAAGVPYAGDSEDPRPPPDWTLADLKDRLQLSSSTKRAEGLWKLSDLVHLAFYRDTWRKEFGRTIEVPFDDLWWMAATGDTVLLSDDFMSHYSSISAVDRDAERIYFLDDWPDRFFLKDGLNEADVAARVDEGFPGLGISRAEFERVAVGIITFDTPALIESYLDAFPSRRDNYGIQLDLGLSLLNAHSEAFARLAVRRIERALHLARRAGDAEATMLAASKLLLVLHVARYRIALGGSAVAARPFEQRLNRLREGFSDGALNRGLTADDLGLIGNSAAMADRLDEALEFFDRAVAADSRNERARELRARTHLLLGHHRKAVFDASEALVLNESNVREVADRKRVRHADDCIGRTEDDRKLAVHAYMKQSELAVRYAAYSALSCLSEAKLDAEALVAIAPEDRVSHARLAMVHEELGKTREAREGYLRALRCKGEPAAEKVLEERLRFLSMVAEESPLLNGLDDTQRSRISEKRARLVIVAGASLSRQPAEQLVDALRTAFEDNPAMVVNIWPLEIDFEDEALRDQALSEHSAWLVRASFGEADVTPTITWPERKPKVIRLGPQPVDAPAPLISVLDGLSHELLGDSSAASRAFNDARRHELAQEASTPDTAYFAGRAARLEAVAALPEGCRERQPIDSKTFARIRECLGEAMRAYEQSGDKELKALCAFELGELMQVQGGSRDTLVEACTHYETVLRTLDTVDDTRICRTAYLHLANCEQELAKGAKETEEEYLAKAIANLDAAELLLDVPPDVAERARIDRVRSLALGARFHGDRDRNLLDALAAGERALRAYRADPQRFPIEYPSLLNHLANCELFVSCKGRERSLQRAQELLQEGMDAVDGDAYPRLAESLQGNLTYTKALLGSGDSSLPPKEMVGRFDREVQDAIIKSDFEKAEAWTQSFLRWGWSLPVTPNTHIGAAHNNLAGIRSHLGRGEESGRESYLALVYLFASDRRERGWNRLVDAAVENVRRFLAYKGSAEQADAWVETARNAYASATALCKEAGTILETDPKGAIEKSRRALELIPEFGLALFGFGLVSLMAGKWHAACDYFGRLLHTHAEDVAGHYNRALARVQIGDVNGALQDYSFVLERSPNNLEAREMRARLRASMGDCEGALGDAEQVVALRPQSSESYGLRAFVREKKGEIGEAIADLRTALSMTESDAEKTEIKSRIEQLETGASS